MIDSAKNKRIVFIQPALPSYRIDFFDKLYEIYGEELEVYYSPGQLGALTSLIDKSWAHRLGNIKSIAGILAWQSGVLGIPFGKNDLLILSGNPRHLSTLILLLKAKYRKTKTIWWGHYWSSTSRRWRQVLRFIPMAISDAKLFYTDDEVERFKFDRFAFFKGRFVKALNNGLDDSKIKVERKAYDASERPRALFFVGRLTPKANLGLAFQALAKLGESAPAFHIVGSGEQEKALKVLASNLGVSHIIHWHGASTSEEFISKVANSCRAFLYPGEVGLSLIHAMCYGLPVIVHGEKELHMPEFAAFEEGVTGLSFSVGSDESLAKLLADNIDNYEFLNGASRNSLLKVADNYTTRSMSDRFCQLVDALDDSK